jgi:hypothetical protein
VFRNKGQWSSPEEPTGMAKDRTSPASPRIGNIVNFIRGVEPRYHYDLLEPVALHMNCAKQEIRR